MSKLPHIVLILSIVFITSGHTESRDEKILKGAGEAAAKAAAQHVVKGFIDKMAAQAASNAGTSAAGAAGASATKGAASEGGVSAGGGVIFAFQLGMAIDDFSKAETDKGKGFAVADAVAAGVTLVNPAVGLVVVAVILVVKLIDGNLSARHAKDLMEIYARVAENYKKVAELETQMVQADAKRFEEGFKQLADAQEKVQRGRDYLEANCSKVELLDSLQKVDECIQSLVQVSSLYRRSLELSTNILKVPTRVLKVDLVLEKMDLTKGDMESALASYHNSVLEMNSTIGTLLDAYGGWTAQLIIQEAAKQSKLSQRILFKQMCLNAARRLTLYGIAALYPNKFKDQIYEGENKLTLNDARDQMENFAYNGCSGVKSGWAELDALYDSAGVSFSKVYYAVDQQAIKP